MKKPLDQTSFEMAKAKCGFFEARYFTGGYGFALTQGQSAPSAEQKRKIECMDLDLAEFEYHVITETPPPE